MASDCGVAPPKKGDGLRSRRGTTRKVEEHFPRHVQGLGWRESSRNFAGRLFGGLTETKIPKRGTCRAQMGEPGR